VDSEKSVNNNKHITNKRRKGQRK